MVVVVHYQGEKRWLLSPVASFILATVIRSAIFFSSGGYG
jgi:hypothetical protein